MEYIPLTKIFYKSPQEHGAIYEKRFQAPTTRHFDFYIREFNRLKEFPSFFCYTEELFLLLEDIFQKRAKVVEITQKVPALVMQQFTLACIIDEVKSSNDIEGVNSTRRELKEALENLSRSPRFLSILRKYEALLSMETIPFQSCSDVRKFYDDFANQEILDSDSDNALDGKFFRKNAVELCSATGKVIHQGVFPEEKILKYMDFTLNVLNDEKIPLLVRVPIFHYFFEYIHPFYDGNGRTARFIVSYFLATHLNLVSALRLSVIIKHNRSKYYKLFAQTNSEINCGDLTPFVLGFLQFISLTFVDIEKILNRKLLQLERYRQKLSLLVNDDALTRKLYDILLQSTSFFGQGIPIEDLITLLGKSRNTIMSRIRAAPQGHIVKSSGKKPFYKLNMMIFKS